MRFKHIFVLKCVLKCTKAQSDLCLSYLSTVQIHKIQDCTFVDFYSLSGIDTLQPFFVFLNFDTVIHALIDIYICIVYLYNCNHHRKGMLIFQIKSIPVTVNFH